MLKFTTLAVPVAFIAAVSPVAFAADPPSILSLTFTPAASPAVEGSPAGTPIGTLSATTVGSSVQANLSAYANQDKCVLTGSKSPATVSLPVVATKGNHACTFSAALGGAVGTPYFQTVVFNVAAKQPPPPLDPTLQISANPPQVTKGSPVTVAWNGTNIVTGATPCTASGIWAGSKAASGTESIIPTASGVATLFCPGVSGKTVTQSSSNVTVSDSPPPPDTTPTNATIGAGEDTLVITIGQDQYQGSATYTVQVDGVQIGGTLTAHALHSNPVKDVVTVKGSWESGNHTAQVQMLEDAWGGDPSKDRNLYVEGAAYNGTVVPGAALSLNTTTPQSFVFSDKALPSVMGPLIHPAGSNYFALPNGTPVPLTGSHTWNNLQDEGSTSPPASLDYAGYLAWMQKNGFNFMRLWNIAEQPYSAAWETGPWYTDPLPYTRTGPGNAADGKPKFDLTKINQAYFDRLRDRTLVAQQKGVYVGVMIFQGWSLDSKGQATNPWKYHPFNSANNVNGINGDPANTGNGDAIQTTSASPAILSAQQAYVRKVIDTVGDLDNVIYEISNESRLDSVQWQYAMINYIKNYEATKPKQHPVGMTAVGARDEPTTNSVLFNSPADWVSPNSADGYKDNPPANDGSKVVLTDTDHLWGGGGSVDWVWKSFTRGLNPIFMDDLGNTGVNLGGRRMLFDPAWYSTRAGMTQVAGVAAKLDLKKAKPHGEFTSTSYALVDPCVQYLVYGTGGGFTVNLSACSGVAFDANWSDLNGTAYAGTQVNGGANANLTPPFAGASVLLLTKSSVTPPPPVISADGTVLQGGATGSLVTRLGTWTFGTAAEPGMWDIRLNNSSVGRGAQMEVAKGGVLYAIGSDNAWWIVTASGWTRASDPNEQPPKPKPTGNVMPITNVSDRVVTSYPFQFGRPFVCGEIQHYPQVIFNGTPLQTQADVKNRCPDGSVKFAVISAVLPSLPVGTSQNVTFRDQPTGNNTIIPAADLLAQFPDFDATTELTKPTSFTGTYESDLAKWKTITNGSLALTIDGKTYNLTGLDFSQLPTLGYEYAYVLNPAIKAANLPATFTMSDTQSIITGGKSISLSVPATGQDIGPLLFKSGVSTAASSAPVSVSARKMLEDGNCQPWTSGPVVATYQCYDRSTARVYDLGPGGSTWRSFHPEFVLSFWLQTKQVSVRYVGEISNTMALEAFTADVKLTAGKASPTVMYQQAAIPHSFETRWTRTLWLGGTPEQKVNIDHNIGYLADANYLPNYDRSLKIPEDILAQNYATYLNWDHKINGAGGWMMWMPNTGYHPEIGYMPVWYLRAVYSGDWRARQVMLDEANQVGAFAMQAREGDPTKKANREQTLSAVGLPVTVYGRPWGWDLTGRSPPNVLGSWDLYQGSDFTADSAHQPDPFFVPYILTGDPYYLDGLQFWAGMNSYQDNPGYRNGPYAVIYGGQARSDAWTLRLLINADLATPDADPLKVIYGGMADDAFGYWEGKRGITGTKYENTAIYKWAASIDDWNGMGPHPLGWWAYVGAGIGGGPWDCQSSVANADLYDTKVCYSLNAPWQQNFVIVVLGRAVELGYAADKLFAYAGSNIIGQLTTEGFNSRQIGPYNIPDAKKDPSSPTGFAYFQNWKDVMTALNPTYGNTKDIPYWPAIGAEIYWDVARGAAGMASSLPATAKLPSGMSAWAALNKLIADQTAQTGRAPDWNRDPTWAIVPRTGH